MRSGEACAPLGADVGEYSSYCARIHDEEIYHDLCAVKNNREFTTPTRTLHTVRWVSSFFVFFQYYHFALPVFSVGTCTYGREIIAMNENLIYLINNKNTKYQYRISNNNKNQKRSKKVDESDLYLEILAQSNSRRGNK